MSSHEMKDGVATQAETEGVKTEELYKVYEVVRLLREPLGSYTLAKNELVELLRDGELDAYSKSIWISESELADIWSDAPKPKKHWKPIDRRKFVGAKNLAADKSNWKWRSGCFYLTKSDGRFYAMKGVRLLRSEVDKIVEGYTASAAKRSKGRRPPEYEKWHRMWRTLFELEREQILNQSQFPKFKMLLNEVLKRTKNDGLSEGSLKPFLREFHKKFVRDYPGSQER